MQGQMQDLKGWVNGLDRSVRQLADEGGHYAVLLDTEQTTKEHNADIRSDKAEIKRLQKQVGTLENLVQRLLEHTGLDVEGKGGAKRSISSPVADERPAKRRPGGSR